MQDRELSKFEFVCLVTVMFFLILEFVELVGDDSMHERNKQNLEQARGLK